MSFFRRFIMIFGASLGKKRALFFINPMIMCEVEFLEDLLWFSQFPHYLYRPDNFMLFWVFRRFIMILAASLFFINPIIMCWNSYDKFLAYLLWLDNVIYFTDNNVLKDLLWWFCGSSDPKVGNMVSRDGARKSSRTDMGRLIPSKRSEAIIFSQSRG